MRKVLIYIMVVAIVISFFIGGDDEEASEETAAASVSNEATISEQSTASQVSEYRDSKQASLEPRYYSDFTNFCIGYLGRAQGLFKELNLPGSVEFIQKLESVNMRLIMLKGMSGNAGDADSAIVGSEYANRVITSLDISSFAPGYRPYDLLIECADHTP